MRKNRVHAEKTHKKPPVRPIPLLQWAGLSVNGDVRLTCAGRKEALIENHRGVASYSAERVELSSRGGNVVLSGEDLLLKEVRPGALVVSGKICAVEFQNV